MRGLTCTVVLMLVVGICVGQELKCNKYSNGCSANNRISNYENRFTSACELHDLCYSCGSKYYVSRKKCDHEFNDNMKRACNSTVRCKLARRANFAWVRASGWASYQKTAKSYCSETWVRPCLPWNTQ